MNKAIQDNIQKLADFVNGRNPRERILIFVGSVVLIVMLWRAMLYGIVFAEDFVQETEQMQQSIKTLQQQITGMTETIGVDKMLAKQVRDLRDKNQGLQQEIQEQTKKMVSPKDMLTIVKNVLNNTQNLSVIKLESTKTKTLFEDTAQNQIVKVYVHGLEVELEGEYFEITNFLTALEKEKLNMIWQDLNYEVKKYPRATVKILLQTLGLEEGWIGV